MADGPLGDSTHDQLRLLRHADHWPPLAYCERPSIVPNGCPSPVRFLFLVRQQFDDPRRCHRDMMTALG